MTSLVEKHKWYDLLAQNTELILYSGTAMQAHSIYISLPYFTTYLGFIYNLLNLRTYKQSLSLCLLSLTTLFNPLNHLNLFWIDCLSLQLKFSAPSKFIGVPKRLRPNPLESAKFPWSPSRLRRTDAKNTKIFFSRSWRGENNPTGSIWKLAVN